ncbi:putative nuclear protein SDK3 [Dactylonectria estremocensis]|uniref:Nuclear protein SDK3 n=1 Tax=Dactylonectria estremocensis TaxID=1079267 RepID=A0A9P9JEF8_9HYPO|nr:putative nuclear protein SDK3 [Dactylonectria estremocensis]
MAAVEEQHPMDGAFVNPEMDELPRDVAELEGRKRKASRGSDRDSSPKRTRHDDDDDGNHAHRRSRRDSPPTRRDSHGSATIADHDRRKSATQEEKKRGKRLFGGLLSTLSQTTGSSQQKRRLEIERRQKERQQKQRVVDDKERAEKLSHLTELRRSEQVVFDKEVMQNKHSKVLAVAKFLKTKSHPQICYLPWKLTADQEDEIDDQLQNAKNAIKKELEAFSARKEWNDRDNVRPSRVAQSATPEELPALAPPIDDSTEKPAQSINGSEQPVKAPDKEHNQHHHHDESADVVEEVDEDMVIY